MGLCNHRSRGDRTSISVWCSHVSATPAYGNQVRTHCQVTTAPEKKRKKGELSRAPQSSEQFVWLNRRYGETETQLSPTAIMPSTRADSSQNAVIEAAATSVGCHPWSASALGSQ